jgi:hypothetical protein
MSLLVEVIELFKKHNLNRQIFKVWKVTHGDLEKTARMCNVSVETVKEVLEKRKDKFPWEVK